MDQQLCEALKSACSRLIVTGSLRRRKPTVGDVEILFVPIHEARQKDMFTVDLVSLAEEAIAALLDAGTLHKRSSQDRHVFLGTEIVSENVNGSERAGAATVIYSTG